MAKPTVLILAGGIGKRFKPLSYDKSIFPFLGKPLIYYQLDLLEQLGFENICIVCNKNNCKTISSLKNNFNNLSIKTVVQDKPKGMGDAIIKASENINNSLLVLNSADIFDKKLFLKILDLINKKDPQAIVPGYEMNGYFPGGYLKIKNNKVIEIVEKPGKGKQPSNLVNLVVHYYKNSQLILKQLKKSKTQKDDLYEKAMDDLMKTGVEFDFVKYKGTWECLKYPQHVLDMMQYFFDNYLKKEIKPKIPANVIVSGKVYIAENVRIYEGAVIKGPVYIGPNSVVGNNALIRESIVESGSVVGSNTEIARSWVGKNCWFHRNYIGDSVIDNNVSFGSGSVTANLRLDEKPIVNKRNKMGAIIGKNTRVGVNTSTMPGIKIGQDCFVSPGMVLDKDLKDGRFIKPENTKYKVVKNKHKIIDKRKVDL